MSQGPEAIAVQYADTIRIRERNTLFYRFCHWPIWIIVFYLAAAPLTFSLFARGFDRPMAIWLGLVCIGTGIAALRGRLPGVEPRPYIIRFTEDRPNPLYRKICYTAAWSALVTYAVLNIAGLGDAIIGGKWHLLQIYAYGWLPLSTSVWILGLTGKLPRTKPSTLGEGAERRVFYGAIWAVTLSQITLWVLWANMSRSRWADVSKLIVFVALLGSLGFIARRGRLPRTRRIVVRAAADGDVSAEIR